MEPSSDYNQPIDNPQCGDPTQGQSNTLKDLQEVSNRSRRNALTPESHNIEPIRQTEIQEKMSSLSMTTTDQSDSIKQQEDNHTGS